MASYVVKAQFGDSLRRLTLSGDLALSFAQLENRARDLFHLPSSAQLVLTYVDKDGDVVTIGEDQDLKDALVLQSLNPLRLSVAVLPSTEGNVPSNVNKAEGAPAAGTENEQSDSTTEGVKQAEAEKPAADVNAENISEPAPAEKVADTKAPVSSLDEGAAAAPAGGDAGNKKQLNAEREEDQVIHHGVTCNDCRVTPISGPRFKSFKKFDYDLCRACFEKPGVDANEYFMVERRFHRPDLRLPFWGGRMMRANPAFNSRGPNSRNARAAAECARAWGFRCPGAEAVRAAAGSESGQTPPPAGDHEKQNADGSASETVVHYGVECDVCGMNPITGPRFTSKTKFNYDLCSGCFEKNDDGVKAEYCRIDRSVFGIHPELLKWYREIAPYAAPMCGDVISMLNKFAKEHAQAQKQAAEDQQGKGKGETSAGPEASASKEATQASTEEKAPVPEAAPEKQAEAAASLNQESAAEKETPVQQADSEVPVQNEKTPAPVARKEDLSTVDGLLAKLAAMGFTDNQLNEELLKKNQMDLRKTLDDLCTAEEWDPILEELQEMGFYDTELNRRLLFANNGSVKRVVKELVQKAREPATAAAKGAKQA